MKRIFIIGMAALLSFSAAGCGKKQDGAEMSTGMSSGSSMIESSEAVGESIISATVQGVDGSRLRVELDDGQSMSFDTSSARMSSAWELMPGDQVEIGYDGEDPVDGMAIKSVAVSVPFEYLTEGFSENNTVYGRVESVDDKSITIKAMLDPRADDVELPEQGGTISEEQLLGESYTFSRASYETVVSKNGVSEGVYAEISYLGELDKPVCFRICTEDMEEEEEAELTGIIGTVEKVEDGVIYLSTEERGFKFATAGDEELLKQASGLVGKQVRVNFSDSLRQRVATADSIAEV